MPPLLRDLLRPHRVILTVLFAAILVQIAMSLAMPWPLKIVFDNVVGNHPAPQWIAWLLPMLGGPSKAHIAAAAAVVTVLIAVVTGVAFYIASYFTESLGQSIGNDLRVRLYHHLQQLSLAYYDTTRSAPILSTLTTDVQTIQSFASASTLNISHQHPDARRDGRGDVLCRWDFTLIALAVTPLLAIFVVPRQQGDHTAVKEVRTHQSRPAGHPSGGPAIDSTWCRPSGARITRRAATAQGQRRTPSRRGSQARRVSSMLSPAVGLVIAVCTGLVLWRGSLLILSGTMTGRRAHRLSRLPGQVLPTGARPRTDDQHRSPRCRCGL